MAVEGQAKYCPKCCETKPIVEFGNQKQSKDGLRSWCKSCDSENARSWYYANHERARETRRLYAQSDAGRATQRKSGLRYRFQWTEDQYNALLEQQDGKCATCGTTEPGGSGRFHIDHDHACCPGRNSCGKCVRGLLCCSCNLLVGQIEKAPQAMWEYLLRGALV